MLLRTSIIFSRPLPRLFKTVRQCEAVGHGFFYKLQSSIPPPLEISGSSTSVLIVTTPVSSLMLNDSDLEIHCSTRT